VLPLTTAVTQVVMLRCGELTVAVPSTLIEVVRRVPVAEVEQAYDRAAYDMGEQMLPFYWLGACCRHSAAVTRPAHCPGGGGPQRGAARGLHVDEVLGNQEVVVKNVGPQLRGCRAWPA
jgi:chemosensory pili system protein ChpA (sensor histidine kinase/response regulator)